MDQTHLVHMMKATYQHPKRDIGELITFDYLHTNLKEEFGTLPWTNRWEAVKDRLCLQNHVGCFDKGSDLTIGEKTIDVKTYHDRILTKDQMIGYNLFVNVEEVKGKDPADYYIQASSHRITLLSLPVVTRDYHNLLDVTFPSQHTLVLFVT